MIEVRDLGRIGYGEALELQRELAEARKTAISPGGGAGPAATGPAAADSAATDSAATDGAAADPRAAADPGAAARVAADPSGAPTDLLLLVEHPPVITEGRTTDPAHTVADAVGAAAAGIERFEIERGGDVTYHGPGQVVGYPILHLGGFRKDLHWYLRSIESTLIGALGRFGLRGFRVAGLTGVWVGDADVAESGASGEAGEGPRGPDATAGIGTAATLTAESLALDRARALVASGAIRKIASIGVHASRWVTTHGFALNHTSRALEGFRWIVPCGISGVTMTSLETEGVAAGREQVVAAVVDSFGAVFGADMRISHPSDAPIRL